MKLRRVLGSVLLVSGFVMLLFAHSVDFLFLSMVILFAGVCVIWELED